MRFVKHLARLAGAALLLALLSHSLLTAAHAQEKRDYLSDAEADKIRDAATPNERIKLFLSFADDRLKKFDYELHRSEPERNRDETLNGLLNAYSGCMDDATDFMDLEIEKGADVRAGIKEIKAKGKEYLSTLQKLEAARGPEFDLYKDTLEDAIEGTKDALSDAQKAEKEMGAVPVRRKP